MYSIYVLKCPYTQDIRYVGLTNQNLLTRLYAHIHESKKSKSLKSQWIRSLGDDFPLIEPLFKVSGKKSALTKERIFIQSLLLKGHKLTNKSNTRNLSIESFNIINTK
jgi:hypothetical protein